MQAGVQPLQVKRLEHLNRYGPSLALPSGLLVDLGCFGEEKG